MLIMFQRINVMYNIVIFLWFEQWTLHILRSDLFFRLHDLARQADQYVASIMTRYQVARENVMPQREEGSRQDRRWKREIGNKGDDIWFFHISWNKSKSKTALLSWLFGQEEFISMKQLNQSATSKGLVYRRGMHGVYILQVYIPKA